MKLEEAIEVLNKYKKAADSMLNDGHGDVQMAELSEAIDLVNSAALTVLFQSLFGRPN